MCHSQSHEENHETHSPLSIDFQSLEFLAIGKSGIVYAIDEERALKEYHSEGIGTERRALARLSPHVNIVKYLGGIDKGCIFERGKSLRKVIQETDQIPLDRKIRWLQEAAEGMRYIHDNGIIHADTRCQNMILVQGCLKIIDFEGYSINGEEATSCYKWFSCKKSPPVISQKTDIFAYGCAIYEVITGRQPYREFVKFDDRMHRVKRLYAQNRFPEVGGLPLGNLMQGCWHGTFHSMSEILQELEAASLPPARRDDVGYGVVSRSTHFVSTI